ncbi:DegV family protein [Mycoplasma corogypsi]|uniref:DegV family protein n=1 Tax=Mycoplasma corogypsi TaxID=2106 RepID=UPI003873C8D1
MKKVGIIIDSFSSLTLEDVSREGYYFLPLQVVIDGKTYLDGYEDRLQILQMLEKSQSCQSSLPRIDIIQETIKQASEECEQVYYIGLSEGLSSTASYFKTFAADYPNVHFIDNHFSGIQFYPVAKKIVELANEGVTPEIIISNVKTLSDKSATLIVPADVSYMVRGGRLKGAKKFILNTLGIIPILSYTSEGTVESIGLKRTIKGAITKAIDKIVEFAHEIPNPDFNLTLGNDDKINEELIRQLQERNIPISVSTLASSVVAVHTGPKAFSINVMPKID